MSLIGLRTRLHHGDPQHLHRHLNALHTAGRDS